MSNQERRVFISILNGVFILVAYFIFVLFFKKVDSGENILKFYAITMLVFIVAGIIIQILSLIFLSIFISVKNAIENKDYTNVSKDCEIIEDEMDKLIELKSLGIGYAFVGIGFVISLITLILNFEPYIMLNIIFISFLAGSIFEGVAKLYFYKRGIKNG
ncbi:MAG: hypothetical protein A2086_08420 [Spirochaetes bacterium GWD1_27_9]|nr:MAG: hypothetical protein A2Z98_00195 [Spirochaetes bacterium GWB1_27_13]OHD20825.1 MAG: hypothetical protein A2Y34_12695 [Spirochaetes bacterium GWC1_27_15]OHD30606.1 MAG: hypothetical protein A2086_08420 [Spirochaetes bacterium GWD1_27_9]